MSTKISIVFYSMYGHIYQLAKAVAEDARSIRGTEVNLYHVPELDRMLPLKRRGAKAAHKAFAHIPVARSAHPGDCPDNRARPETA